MAQAYSVAEANKLPPRGGLNATNPQTNQSATNGKNLNNVADYTLRGGNKNQSATPQPTAGAGCSGVADKTGKKADINFSENDGRDMLDDRHFCRECRMLVNSRCTASDTRYHPVDTHPRRCVDFMGGMT